MSLRNLQIQKGKTTSTYLPTIAIVANLDSIPTLNGEPFFSVSGNLVQVWGFVQADPTSSTVIFEFSITLPFSRDFSDDFGIVGMCSASDTDGIGGLVRSDAASNLAVAVGAAGVASLAVAFQFAYLID